MPKPPTDITEDELIQQAMQELEAELPVRETKPQAEAPQEPPQAQPQKSFLQKAGDAWKSVGGGIAKAGFETKDFIFGEPAEEDKSSLRRGVEQRSKELAEESAVNSVSMGVSQMVTGLIGAGKIMGPVKFLQKLKTGGKAARATYEVTKAAAASTVVLDPHEERLSDIIEEFPTLQNPVTAYLAADPDDSAAEGRFKNAIESIGVDFALLGAVKVVKLLRAGRQDEALKEIKKLEPGAKTEKATPPFTQEATPSKPAEELPGKAADDAVEAAPASPVTEGAPVSTRHTPPAISDDTIAAILKGSADDDAALRKFGSREAAAESGQIMARADSLPWQKLRGTEEVLAFTGRVARVLKSQMDAAKGGDVLSDARVSTMVQSRAELFGEDPLLVMGQLSEAGEAASSMVANMEASYLLANRMFQETYDAAFRLRNGMLDEWGGDAAQAGKELQARLAASADLLASAKSMSSNSGRALRRMRGQFQVKPEDLAAIGKMDVQRLADLIFQTGGDPKKLAQVANPSFLRRAMDEATFSLTNSLLWLWPTHVTNMTTSLYMLAARPAEKLLGSVAIAPKAGGDILRQRAIKEYVYTVASLGDAWQAMKDAFLRGDSILSPHNTEFFQGGATLKTAQQPLPWKSAKSIWDIAHNAMMAANYRTIVGLPTRTLGAADEFFKTLRYRAYVQAEAATRANAARLTGDDFRQYVSREMEKAIDPATGQALDQKALQEAQVTTFQQELLPGTVGATIQQARARHPILTFIVPFVKTPINVLRYSWKMTPGLNLLQKEFRDAVKGAKGAEAQAQAVGQMALGTTFMGLAASMALNGKMTGAGPTDPELQKELRATGWQPYSYIIEGEDGSKKYIPMGRLDPASMAMSMVADLVEALRHDPEGTSAEKGIGALGMAMAKNFSDKTFLQNMHQALEALSDSSGRKGERYLATVAGNTIPLSSALRGVNPDPYMREARTFIDTMLKNLPGFSETLPPTRDVFGEPVWRRVGLSTSSEADTLEAEHTRIMLETGKSIGKPDPKLDAVDLRDITLKDGRNAYDTLQILSGHIPGKPSLKDVLAKEINKRSYQVLPDGDPDVTGTRIHRLGSITQKYRQAAKSDLLRRYPELQPIIKKRQKEARGAVLKNLQARQSGDPGARDLLDALRGTN
ncbi:hypothetical protein GHK78_19435 [Sinorhizobium meliloti]|nr:hypothetical protein [Sinorhizobium meliloti]